MIFHSTEMKYMNDNATVDTNILIYAFGTQNNSKKNIAKEIIANCNRISLQAVSETVYVLQRKFNFSVNELNIIIQFLNENFQVQNADIFILKQAIGIMGKYKYAFWDSMMLASALTNKCTVIYSEDMQHEQTIDGKLTIINPFIT
jgi:predicted nucleic acid-binding protein